MINLLKNNNTENIVLELEDILKKMKKNGNAHNYYFNVINVITINNYQYYYYQ